MSRYDKLLELVEETKPATILEIGVYNGAQAIKMSEVAFRHSETVHYMGYDLFDDASPVTDAEEFNLKKTLSVQAVKDKLNSFAETHPGFTFELHRGNTRETLADRTADFVYIDGGHSVETIRSDYERTAKSPMVVFDDYYRPDAAGACPDLAKFGANEIVDAIAGAEVIDSTDPVKGGGIVCLAVVRRAAEEAVAA